MDEKYNYSVVHCACAGIAFFYTGPLKREGLSPEFVMYPDGKQPDLYEQATCYACKSLMRPEDVMIIDENGDLAADFGFYGMNIITKTDQNLEQKYIGLDIQQLNLIKKYTYRNSFEIIWIDELDSTEKLKGVIGLNDLIYSMPIKEQEKFKKKIVESRIKGPYYRQLEDKTKLKK